MTGPTAASVSQHRADGFDRAFELAAALAELVLILDQRPDKGLCDDIGTAVAISDARIALLSFHGWVEAAP